MRILEILYIYIYTKKDGQQARGPFFRILGLLLVLMKRLSSAFFSITFIKKTLDKFRKGTCSDFNKLERFIHYMLYA